VTLPQHHDPSDGVVGCDGCTVLQNECLTSPHTPPFNLKKTAR
jgi:hypothetical protein